MQKLIMTSNNKIKDEKLQYNINREAGKVSSGKIHKYEYLIGEEILPTDQNKIIEQVKFTYSPLGKVFEKKQKQLKKKGKTNC